MRFRLIVTTLAVLVAANEATAQERSRTEQIGDALHAAPESMRPGATVLGYGGEPRNGDVLTLLREGTNDLVCLADDPEREGFHTACYHRGLDDYMALGRRLRAEGVGRSAVMDARYEAWQSGELEMPERAALFSVTADEPPAADGTLAEARRLTVVYLPGATGEEVGLPTRPDGGAPWLMLAGTPWAHVMISR